MKFCKKCSSPLRIQKVFDDLSYSFCDRCQDFDLLKGEKSISFSEKISQGDITGRGIVGEGNIFATYENKCSKCGYDKAQVIDLGIFYSDEDNLMFIKCGKCGYSERVGRKTM